MKRALSGFVSVGLGLLLVLACAGSPAPVSLPAPVPAEAPAPVEPPTPAEVPAPVVGANRPPEGWVDLAVHVPGIVLDIRYHGSDNFSGAQIPGYGVPGAWLRRVPADALVRVQAKLADNGLGLKVFDAYRPLRGTLGMVAWAKRTNQVHLLDDHYISRRSGHNRGNTIDLTVVTLATGAELDMGTAWDTLSEASHTANATGTALENRLLLKGTMRPEGFVNYWKEWWHFVYVEDGEKELPHRDVPYACFEAAESAWTPPVGWERPGWVMKPAWATFP